MRLPCLLALGLLGLVPSAAAQGRPTGVVGLTADSLPRVERPDGGGEQGAHELRWHATARSDWTLGRLRLSASGFFDALVARRSSEVITTAAIVRPEDEVAELRFEKADVRLGYGRVIWGRLDEVQPTDVISPIDLTRFFLDGRSEARMAVAHARARFIPSDRLQVEAVLVPQFRPSTFDQLDETSSPFSLRPTRVCAAAGCVPLTYVSQRPDVRWSHLQGGARASVTTGRVDWSVSTYRGFEGQALYELAPAVPGAVPVVRGLHPRFTMVGADAETVRGEWGVRGEVAWFPSRMLSVRDGAPPVPGQALSAGIGADRKAGAYRVAANAVLNRRAPDGQAVTHDMTVVGIVERNFARETRVLRAVGVMSPDEGSGFARLSASFNLRDGLWLDALAGMFWGSGTDALSRLGSRDLVSLRLKVFY